LIPVPILFACKKSIYNTLPGVDVFDIQRDARSYDGSHALVAHPPCRAWGHLKHFSKHPPEEIYLARMAVDLIRINGGVLEHPARSSLWPDCSLPLPGKGFDVYGGFTFAVSQHWFGHRAVKMTWLYIVGIKPTQLPAFDLFLGDSSHVIGQSRNRRDRPEVSKKEREATPVAFAQYLLNIARLIEISK